MQITPKMFFQPAAAMQFSTQWPTSIKMKITDAHKAEEVIMRWIIFIQSFPQFQARFGNVSLQDQ